MQTVNVACINRTKALDTAEKFLMSIPKSQRDNVDIELIEEKSEETYSKLKMHQSDMFVTREVPYFKNASECYKLQFEFDEKFKEFKSLIDKAFETSKGFKDSKDFGKKSTFRYEA